MDKPKAPSSVVYVVEVKGSGRKKRWRIRRARVMPRMVCQYLDVKRKS